MKRVRPEGRSQEVRVVEIYKLFDQTTNMQEPNVCGVLHCHGSNARALGLGDVVRSLAMGPLRALS